MKKLEINGITFTVFEEGHKVYFCTGEPTGELRFDWAGEVADYYTVVGATSVVSAPISTTVDELYKAWLIETEFYREVLGAKF